MKRVINKKLYDTSTAELIANNEFQDGANKFNQGRAVYLYRTRKGQFFAHYVTCWQGEQDSIESLTIPEAIELFEFIPGNPDVWPEEFGPLEDA
ncbi:MAG: hypothetical protein EHM49_00345 [Deltaproteobacteria bacterium]|nr:MAG: hypothetical protein EHM49_00345 [Deltaproteobacteria bacterium]